MSLDAASNPELGVADLPVLVLVHGGDHLVYLLGILVTAVCLVHDKLL